MRQREEQKGARRPRPSLLDEVSVEYVALVREVAWRGSLRVRLCDVVEFGVARVRRYEGEDGAEDEDGGEYGYEESFCRAWEGGWISRCREFGVAGLGG